MTSYRIKKRFTDNPTDTTALYLAAEYRLNQSPLLSMLTSVARHAIARVVVDALIEEDVPEKPKGRYVVKLPYGGLSVTRFNTFEEAKDFARQYEGLALDLNGIKPEPKTKVEYAVRLSSERLSKARFDTPEQAKGYGKAFPYNLGVVKITQEEWV